jgi:acylphosphatase
MSIRRTTLFSGRVQGVGFRYTAVRLARNFKVVGTVKNLSDGRVELIAEGEPEEIDHFVEAIHVQMGDLIREAQSTNASPTGRHQSFDIAY